MKKIWIASAVAAAMIMTGCGSSSDTPDDTSVELELDGKSLIFYGANSNDHLAYSVDEETLIDLNTYEEDDDFAMDANNAGKLFVWDDNISGTIEEKVIMLKEEYTYSPENPLTWEDFYYLGHFHAEEENNETHYHLAAHGNDEFNPEDGIAGPIAAMARINTYLQSQYELENDIKAKLSTLSTPAELCGFKTVTKEDDTRQFVMTTNGSMYVYNEDLSTPIYHVTADMPESCVPGKMGLSPVSHEDESGIVLFEADSQRLYLVDSHDGQVYHVHSDYDVSDVTGSDKDVDMMVSLIPAGYEDDHDEDEHDDDDHDH